MTQAVGLKELREHTKTYVNKLNRGNSFIVYRRSQPLFKLTPLEDEEHWEEVIDLTKLKKGGVCIEDILKRL